MEEINYRNICPHRSVDPFDVRHQICRPCSSLRNYRYYACREEDYHDCEIYRTLEKFEEAFSQSAIEEKFGRQTVEVRKGTHQKHLSE